MAKNSVADYDPVSANNTDIGGTNINEGCPAEGINDAIRKLMAQIKSAFASVPDILAGTLEYVFISPKRMFDAAAWYALSDAATVTVDQNNGLNFTITLGGNRAIANMTNPKPGTGGYIEVVQDATGSRVPTFGANYEWPGNVQPLFSTTAGTIDMVAYVVRSPTVIRCNIVKGFFS